MSKIPQRVRFREPVKQHRPANDEMVQGYMDGYDLTAPEPSENRSASYRHGFMVGRGEKTGTLAGTYESLVAAAEAAMDEDAKTEVAL